MNVYNKIKDYISFPFVYEDNFAWSFMKNPPPPQKKKLQLKCSKKKKKKIMKLIYVMDVCCTVDWKTHTEHFSNIFV